MLMRLLVPRSQRDIRRGNTRETIEHVFGVAAIAPASDLPHVQACAVGDAGRRSRLLARVGSQVRRRERRLSAPETERSPRDAGED